MKDRKSKSGNKNPHGFNAFMTFMCFMVKSLVCFASDFTDKRLSLKIVCFEVEHLSEYVVAFKLMYEGHAHMPEHVNPYQRP